MSWWQKTKTIRFLVGLVLVLVSAAILWITEVMTFTAWWGLGGFLAAVFVPPLIVFFPCVFRLIEGPYPTYYVMAWLLAALGMALAASAMDRR